MIITTTTIMIVQVIILTWIFSTTPADCPRKYMKSSEITRYCELDYGGKWKLKEE